jgi:hypothetical protein
VRSHSRSVRLGAFTGMQALAVSLPAPAQADDPTPGGSGSLGTTYVPPTAAPGGFDEPWPDEPRAASGGPDAPWSVAPDGPPAAPPAPEARSRAGAEAAESGTGSITGRLLVPAGTDPAALTVTSSQDGISGVVAADGSFTLSHVSAGNNRLQVRGAGGKLAPVLYPHPTTWAYVSVVAGQVTSDVQIEVPRGGTFAGTVTGPDGPVAGAEVTAWCAWLGLSAR